MLEFGVLPLLNSSLILSKIRTFASTAIPTVSTIPAIPDRVKVAWNSDKTATIIIIFETNAIFATNPKSLY